MDVEFEKRIPFYLKVEDHGYLQRVFLETPKGFLHSKQAAPEACIISIVSMCHPVLVVGHRIACVLEKLSRCWFFFVQLRMVPAYTVTRCMLYCLNHKA